MAHRLAGVQGVNPVYLLETGFGGGKTHALIGAWHLARGGRALAPLLTDYGIKDLPAPGASSAAAFVGEESDALNGTEIVLADGTRQRAFTPWGQLALMSGGLSGYHLIAENDRLGVAPSRDDLEQSLGDGPLLILIDELVLYMARASALSDTHERGRVNSQWPTFLQALFSIAARRDRTSLILTLPSEQDANRRLVGELKQHLGEVLELEGEVEQTTGRQARNLTPTQTHERAAVLGRRLFQTVDSARAGEVARTYAAYYQQQRDAGVGLDNRALDPGYADLIRSGYPFHPELIRLFAERLADIPEFQATRGALRLVARTVRATWDARSRLGDVSLLQPQHLDLTRPELRDELLARLGRTAFEHALDADVTRADGATHASDVQHGWPWPAATESALVTLLHSLPEGSRGVTSSEVALALGRPGCDLAYVPRALEETERVAWYMRREGDFFLFRTRASINKRYQERLTELQSQPGEVRQVLDGWIEDVYSDFSSFQIIHFPNDHTAIPDSPDRLRLVIVHYDKEAGAVGAGDRLSFTRELFERTGVYATARRYRNNVVFLLAESSRVIGLKDAARSLIAWERVASDIETEQRALADASGASYTALRDAANRGAAGVPAEFLALHNDLGEVRQRLGSQELNVRSRLLEAYRVLAFPQSAAASVHDLFSGGEAGPVLECFRVEFGEVPTNSPAPRRNARQALAEGPILQCLRAHQKLVPEATAQNPTVLAPALVRQPPLWGSDERRVSTEEVWDRLRRLPELPFVLKETDLFPTLQAGLRQVPEPLWTYYKAAEKQVFTRESANDLICAIAPDHFLYDVASATDDRIFPVLELSAREVEDYLWPRTEGEPAPSATTVLLHNAAAASPHLPVLPGRAVLWRALQEGARENRWVLYLPASGIAIGNAEMAEWPGQPRLDEQTLLYRYDAAVAERVYPRSTDAGGTQPELPLSPANLLARCWADGSESMTTEEIERRARDFWPGLARPQLEEMLRRGHAEGLWILGNAGAEQSGFFREDHLPGSNVVGPDWLLIKPGTPTAQSWETWRPGRGPQPVQGVGTPREALTAAWDALAAYPQVAVAELRLVANNRHTFDNTLIATWGDRPVAATTHAAVAARGRREIAGKTERVSLDFEGRFDEIRGILGPIWPFDSQGELGLTITCTLRFSPPVPLSDPQLATYRAALTNANQGQLEVDLVPSRAPRTPATQAAPGSTAT